MLHWIPTGKFLNYYDLYYVWSTNLFDFVISGLIFGKVNTLKTFRSGDLAAVGIGYLHYEIQNESTVLGGTTVMRIVPLHGLNQIYARYTFFKECNFASAVWLFQPQPTFSSRILCSISQALNGHNLWLINQYFKVVAAVQSNLYFRLMECYVSHAEHELYLMHSFVNNQICFDQTRLNVRQTEFHPDLVFQYRTFKVEVVQISS